jgi:hypothetical protein
VRTKPCEGVLRLDVVALEPIPTVYLAYDGLAGISQRAVLPDLFEELQRQGPDVLKAFLKAVRKRGSAQVHVYFSDYVSYGIGGGDATAEFFLASYYVFAVDAHRPFWGSTKEELVMPRPAGIERMPWDALP